MPTKQTSLLKSKPPAATIPLLISIPGALVGGMMCEWLGPRRLLLLLSPLLCASFVLMRVAVWEVVVQAGLAEVLLLSCRVVQVGALPFGLLSLVACKPVSQCAS